MTNNDCFKAYSEYAKTHYNGTSYRTHTGNLKLHFLSKYGDREVSSMLSSDINSIYGDMEKKGRAVNTLYGVQSTLCSYFNFAVENNYKENNPMESARKILPSVKIVTRSVTTD